MDIILFLFLGVCIGFVGGMKVASILLLSSRSRLRARLFDRGILTRNRQSPVPLAGVLKV